MFMKFIKILSFILISNSLSAAEPFHVMTCRAVFSDKWVVRIASNKLTVQINDEHYAIPLEDCSFSEEQIGKFTCKSTKNEEKVQSISNRFFKRHRFNVMQITITTQSDEKLSPIFIVEKTNSEGFAQPSECRVDNEELIVSDDTLK